MQKLGNPLPDVRRESSVTVTNSDSIVRTDFTRLLGSPDPDGGAHPARAKLVTFLNAPSLIVVANYLNKSLFDFVAEYEGCL